MDLLRAVQIVGPGKSASEIRELILELSLARDLTEEEAITLRAALVAYRAIRGRTFVPVPIRKVSRKVRAWCP